MATIGASRYVCILTAFLTVIASYRPTLAQVSLNRACSEQARYKSDVGPNTIRLIDADCSQETPPKIGTSFVDKNYRSQFMHGVIKLRLRNLWGQGITVGVWDAGHVLDRHVELAGRISFGDPKRTIDANIGPVPVPLHEHSTHVAGTIGASGTTQETAQGMAPKVKIVSFFWGEPGQDVEDLKRAAELGISATNHSYGAPGGWEFGPRGSCQENWSWLGRDGESSDVRFGVYDETARDFDKVVFQSQTLSVFVAAGNERGPTSSPEQFRNDPRPWANFTGAHCVFSSGEWKRSLSVRKSDLWKNGFDTITGRGLAKNVITIGAAVRLDPPFDNSAIVPTAFSSMGPADDGRIKPDLLANGDELYSTFLPKRCSNEYCYTKDLTSAELALYATLPGTSMATPIATGISALLNQQSLEGKRGRILFADEMKAALIHTARSPTDDGRPSYRWGWGLIDAFRASELVDGRIGSLTRRAISDGATDVSLAWDDQRSPLAITATWIDDPGHPIQPPTLDDRTPSLINRLDVRLVSPGGKIYFPWSLNPEKPEQIATNNTANLVDNVQRIDVGIDDWEAGTWRLKIKSSRTQTVHLALAMSNSVKLKE